MPPETTSSVIDVLMPVAGTAYAPIAADYLTPYRAAFAAAGLSLTPRPWNEGPGNGAATLALFAWGYHFDVPAWEAMLAAWPADRLLLNPPALLSWNTRKTYLLRLADAGVPIVPSLFGRADDTSVAAAFDAFDTPELVSKPQVSAGSHLTLRVRRGDPVAPIDDAIIQPFLPAIAEEGELSLLFIGGRFSHAVRKVATGGDFRIQPQFGGRFSVWEPEARARDLAHHALTALPVAPLYARVDLIRLPGDTLALMELEAIEPDLYTALEPRVCARLAAAMAGALG